MELPQLGKEPISQDQPVGSDVRYDPEFEQLQSEIDKLSVPSADGKGIDWNKVVKLSSSILAWKSKHLLVGTYLCASLLETRKLEGLTTGLTILNDLVDNYWDTMYPSKKRMQGRLNAIRWWLERTESFFEKFSTDPLPEETVEELRGSIRNLDQTLAAKSDDAPSIMRLIDYVNRFPTQVKEEPEPEPAKPATEQPKTTQAAEAGEPRDKALTRRPTADITPPLASAGIPANGIETRKDAEKLVGSCLKELFRASGFLMKGDLSNPLVYRLNRVAAWSTVDCPPPATAGQTLIPAPDPLVRSSLDTLFSNGEYANGILTSESRVMEFLFWLDLSFLTSQALEQMGEKYRAALDMVCMETASYVQRLPGIENLAFSDGTPFADRETRAWLKSIALSRKEDSVLPAAGGEGVDSRVAEALVKARALAKDKKTADAVLLFQDNLRCADSGRSRLLWRIALARLLVECAKPELARPHLDEIRRQIDRYSLEEWDTALALSGLRVIYEALAEEEGVETKALVKDTLDRIARISPVDALFLAGQG